MRLIIFDLDQTIVGLYKLHDKAAHFSLKKIFNINAWMHEIDYVGKSLKKTLNEIAWLGKVKSKERKKNINNAVKLHIEYFIKYLPKNTKKYCLPGSINLIKNLSKMKNNYLIILSGDSENLSKMKNNYLIILSGDSEKIIKIVLKRAGLLKYFKLIVSGEKIGSRTKLIKKALKLAHKKAKTKKFERVFVIGDSIHDVEAGKAIKAMTIVLTTGTHTKKQLKKEGADYIFRNLKNKRILNLIEKEDDRG
jgi:phosphoglycolate phosphatase-like HAD superfamily hydrolase